MKLCKSVVTTDAVSVSFLDNDSVLQILDLHEAEKALEDLAYLSEKIEESISSYEGILDCINKCGGVTQSLEHMYGENFSSAASMEAEATAEVQAWYQKTWQWIKDFFAKLWAWFKSFFQTSGKTIKALEALISNADKVAYPVRVPKFNYAEVTTIVNELTREMLKTFDEKSEQITSIQMHEKLTDLGTALDAAFGFKAANPLILNNAAELNRYADSLIKGLQSCETAKDTAKKLEESMTAWMKEEEDKAKSAITKAAAKATNWTVKKTVILDFYSVNLNVSKGYIRLANMLLSAAKVSA